MATFYVTHHLYPDNPQMFVVDVQQIVKLSGEAGTAFSYRGRTEHFWEIIIYTSGKNSSDERLGPYWLDMVGSAETVNELINNKINDICSIIDWSKSWAYEDGYAATISEDRYPPVVHWQYPSAGQVDVPIDSNIVVRLRDVPPAKGIDISTLTMKVDGFDVVPDVYGNPFDYTLSFKPRVSK